MRVTLLRGGERGFGNAHYKTSTNRAPRKATKGWPGEERWVCAPKLIADAGLIGLLERRKIHMFLAATTACEAKNRGLSVHDLASTAWCHPAVYVRRVLARRHPRPH